MSERKLGKSMSYFHNSLLKYGKDNFKVELIEKTNQNELSEREIYWIKKLQSNNRDIGYNLGEGGETAVRSPEVARKIGKKTKERWQNPAHAKVMREGLKKATQIWVEKNANNRIIKHCIKCGKEMSITHSQINKKYCSILCKNNDIDNWLSYQKGIDAALIKNKENGRLRAAKIKNITLAWARINKEYILSIPKNQVTSKLKSLINLVESETGIKDIRSIANAVCNTLSRKQLLIYLQDYVKMYAVPD